MKIYIDYDSTLVDLMDAWLFWIKDQYRVKVKKQDITGWDYLSNTYGEEFNNFWKQKGIYEDVNPIPGSVAFMRIIVEHFGYENIFIISNSHCDLEREKEAHAKKWFNIDSDHFMHHKDKWKYTSDGILIDDATHNVVDHIKANNTPAILFNYRNTYGWSRDAEESHYLKIAYTYNEVLEYVASDHFKTFFEAPVNFA